MFLKRSRSKGGTLQGLLHLDWQTFSSITISLSLFINTNYIRNLNMGSPLFSAYLEPSSCICSYAVQLPCSAKLVSLTIKPWLGFESLFYTNYVQHCIYRITDMKPVVLQFSQNLNNQLITKSTILLKRLNSFIFKL